MRVISGFKKGTSLYAPANDSIRPTTDRIKEDIFNIINFYIDNALCLDLFSGSGSIGIEFLSRNGKHCDFVEVNKENLNLIKKNIDKVQFSNFTIFNMDAFEYICTTQKKYDIIFLDPPYNKKYENKMLSHISESNILADNGIIIVEHSIDTILEAFENIEIFKEKNYKKTTKITFFRKRVV